MSGVVITKSQDEYEDDFEKDLDWLISEESRSEDQGPDFKDIEEEKRGKKSEELKEDEERWPSPMDPLEYDSDRDSPNKSSTILPPPPEMEEQTEEEKKYIQEKIQQANRELQDQEAPSMTRRRRLHFKETLVDLVVSPQQFEKGDTGEVEGEQCTKDSKVEIEVSGKLSELKLSPRQERESGRAAESIEGGLKEGKVLVEKDGKFDLVSLKEVESMGLLPPIANNSMDFSFSRHTEQTATYSLSPQQKELLQRIEQRKNRLAREEEQRKQEEEEQKRQENELAFKAWLMKKREQFQEEKRIHRAQEMERNSAKRDSSDPEETFRLWLQRKQEQQQRERHLLELKRLEEDSGYLLRSREECERAFKLWLKRKRAEKQAEQQAARERSRRLVLEERRARRMRDLLCTVNETKSFRFTEQLDHRF
ncbi:hypothetical protein KUCAC02_022708 [Chaenocephalus aceratus]|uniref:Uncharacterized protein n=1 Tax=Chaenocephalus aceratus TaxID=36190 RepID=A0ACB9XNT1_CHAAC|nr:hypothetical protein KUCAC02_022708 [Chaenocephalus aceratus]